MVRELNDLNKKSIDDKIEFDEESLSDKIKKKSGIVAIVGTGVLGLLHTASHLIPAIGAIGYMQGYTKLEEHHTINVLGYDINPILSHPIMQVAYVGFVFLGFYYIYRDHKHHKHEHIIKKRLYETQKLLESTQRELKSYKIEESSSV